MRPISSEAQAAIAASISAATSLYPVSSTELAARYGTNRPMIRKIVHRLRIQGTPIASDLEGYWLARTPSELDGTLRHLRSRATKIWAAYQGLHRAIARMTQTDLLTSDPQLNLDIQTERELAIERPPTPDG